MFCLVLILMFCVFSARHFNKFYHSECCYKSFDSLLSWGYNARKFKIVLKVFDEFYFHNKYQTIIIKLLKVKFLKL